MELLNETNEKYLKALVYSEPGCLAGDVRVPYYIRHADGITKHNDKGGPIEHLYRRFNGIPTPGKGYYQRPRTINARYFVPCMTDDWGIITREIAAVVNSGAKGCVTVVTASGRTITCTPDHLFATDDGYAPVTDIGIGGRLLIHRRTVHTAGTGRGRVPQSRRPQVYVKNHPFAKQRTVRVSSGVYVYNGLSRARAVLEASMNGLSKDEYIDRLNAGRLEGLVFVQPGMDVHHIDEDPFNDVPGNLVAISHAEHAREHVDADLLKYFASEDEIVSIEDAGVHDTYDLKMKEAPHNFVAADFVVHNCGKSSLGATAPSALILLSERHGAAAILQSAERLKVKRPTTLHMRSLADYRAVIVALRGDQSKPFKVLSQGAVIFEGTWPQTVVLDSLTDACRLIEDEIRESGKDTETMSFPQYGTLKVRAERLITAFRDAPAHVLFLCLMDDKGEGLDRTLRPKLPGRGLPDFAAASVNVVAVADRKVTAQKDGAEALVEYRAHTVRTGPYMLKPMRPLRDIEEMNFTKWVNKVFGETKVETKGSESK